jgi:hypothetical protein
MLGQGAGSPGLISGGGSDDVLLVSLKETLCPASAGLFFLPDVHAGMTDSNIGSSLASLLG